MTYDEPPYEFDVIEVSQPLATFYAASIPARILLQVTYPDPARVEGVTDRGLRISGIQRAEKELRHKEIGDFIDTVEAAFPNSIILGANYSSQGLLVQDYKESQGVALDVLRRWRIETEDGTNRKRLIIPTAEPLAAIIDGQHRLHGFNHAHKESRKDEMNLLCAIYLDLPVPYQAYLFATINFNQRKVDRSLAYELFAFSVEDESAISWSPEKAAVFFTRRLNVDDDSPLQGRIIVAPEDVKGEMAVFKKKGWSVSTATIVDGILKLISTKPKADRDLMHSQPTSERTRAVLHDDKAPFREWYKRGNDQEIYAAVRNFLTACNSLLWKDCPPDSAIIKTIGIQAQFDVLHVIAPQCTAEKDVRTEKFEKILKKATAIKFTDDFFEASGRGRIRLRNAILVCIGSRSFDSLPEGDIEGYKRVGVTP